MKITIVGSIKFADKLVNIYNQLKQLGHMPQMHEEMFAVADGTAKQIINDSNIRHSAIKKKYNFIKQWHNLIVNSEAILVCNFDKNGIKNYIGGNVLMEIGFAHVNDKKIFLLNPLPENCPYLDEIEAMYDKIINGDLTKIK